MSLSSSPSGGASGQELGYAEVTTTDTTTNTTYGSTSAKVSGLSITVVGTGRPVDIEMFCPICYHSVANISVAFYLLINNSVVGGNIGVTGSASTSTGRSLYSKCRKVLTSGTTYVFEVGKWAISAGTATFSVAADFPMYISVTQR